MTLAEVLIDMRNPSAQQAIRNCNDMHRNIMKAFAGCGGACPRKDMGVQYRLIQKENRLTALVMSNEPGNWEAVRGNGYTLLREREMDDVLSSLKNGRMLGMDIFCVPTKKTAVEGKNSRRRFLCTEAEREGWLRRKGEAMGFEVLSYRENGTFQAMGYKKNMPIRFGYVNVAANIRINDEQRFREAYSGGIGAEKAYGMGMMLLSGRAV